MKDAQMAQDRPDGERARRGSRFGNSGLFYSLVRWLDSDAGGAGQPNSGPAVRQVDWLRVTPFILMHLACLAVFLVEFSWAAALVAGALYVVRMFAITGFYHRYFSHRSFKTSRAVQFIFAVIGASSTQRGPLWWAAHHRKHHRHADTELDVHSPRQHGFWWSHMGWITAAENFPTDMHEVRDLAKYQELRWLNRYDIVVPIVLAISLFLLGGWPFLVWGYFVSTVVLFHGTCLINSLAHRMGTRRFDTDDDSRNSLILALVTLGEGWHNNHHRYPGAARQGFYWWEIDITYYGLRLLQSVGLIRDLRPVPARVIQSGAT